MSQSELPGKYADVPKLGIEQAARIGVMEVINPLRGSNEIAPTEEEIIADAYERAKEILDEKIYGQ
jgi:hypothetical protein